MRHWGFRDAEDNLSCWERMSGPVDVIKIKKKKAIEHKLWNTTHPEKRQWSYLGWAVEWALQVKTGKQWKQASSWPMACGLCSPDAQCDEVQEEGNSMQEMLGDETGEMSWSHFMRSSYITLRWLEWKEKSQCIIFTKVTHGKFKSWVIDHGFGSQRKLFPLSKVPKVLVWYYGEENWC